MNPVTKESITIDKVSFDDPGIFQLSTGRTIKIDGITVSRDAQSREYLLALIRDNKGKTQMVLTNTKQLSAWMAKIYVEKEDLALLLLIAGYAIVDGSKDDVVSLEGDVYLDAQHTAEHLKRGMWGVKYDVIDSPEYIPVEIEQPYVPPSCQLCPFM